MIGTIPTMELHPMEKPGSKIHAPPTVSFPAPTSATTLPIYVPLFAAPSNQGATTATSVRVAVETRRDKTAESRE